MDRKEEPVSPETPLIILVDDDPDFLEIGAHALKADGYRVACFVTPSEALEQMQREKPRMVITDLMMKDLDAGFSFSRAIKDDPHLKDILVVIVTAIGSQRGFDFRPRTQADLEAMRADAYLEKPVMPDVLQAKVRELLGKRQGEQKR